MKPITTLTEKGILPEVCLRLVLAGLAHDESTQRVALRQEGDITPAQQERLGDIIEAAGGVLGPYTPSARALMASMHRAHNIDQLSDTDALSKLGKLAIGITELSWLVHKPRDQSSTNLEMFDVLRALKPDGAVLPPVKHGRGC
jgi:hypothetical protein